VCAVKYLKNRQKPTGFSEREAGRILRLFRACAEPAARLIRAAGERCEL